MSGNAINLDGVFSIGNVHVARKRNLLIVENTELSLEPRVMDVLCYLSQFAPEVVARDDLIENIWKIEYGGDESLTRAISILRKTLKYAGIDKVMIETIPKRGYRLTTAPRVAAVTTKPDTPVADTPKSNPAPRSKPGSQSKLTPKSEPRITPETVPKSAGLSKSVLWGGITAVAVGVIGLFYILPGSTNPDAPTDVTEELSAIADFAIEVCQGQENIKSVSLEDGIACKKISLSDADKARYVDMARTRDPSNFMEGLDQLEAHAITVEDWRLLAELSFGTDTNRSIKAIRKALVIDPDNFFLQTLLSQAYAVSGRRIEALNSIENLKASAGTDSEKFIAAYTFVTIATELQYSELLEGARSELSALLVETESSLSADLKAKSVNEETVEAHPYWSLATGYQALADADRTLGNTDASLKSLDQSDKFYKLLSPIRTGKAEFAPFYRLVINNGKRAFLFKEAGNIEGALKAHQENLLLYFDLRDIDYKSVGIRFPDTWFEMGELYLLKNDPENAKLMFENSEQKYQSLLDKNSNYSEALMGLEKSREKLDEIKDKL